MHHAIKRSKDEADKKTTIGPLSLNFVTIMIRYSIVPSEIFFLKCSEPQLALNSFVHECCAWNKSVPAFQVQSALRVVLC